MTVWTPRLIDQRGPATVRIARDPFVPGFTTDAVRRTQFGHRPELRLILGDKRLTLFHRGSLLPRHRALRGKVLPMYPDGSVTDVCGRCHHSSSNRQSLNP